MFLYENIIELLQYEGIHQMSVGSNLTLFFFISALSVKNPDEIALTIY